MTTHYLLGLDPGTTDTAWLRLETPTLRIIDHGFQPNVEILGLLTHTFTEFCLGPNGSEQRPVVVCEMIQSFGMSVGQAIFETCRWVGRFEQKAIDLGMPFHTLYRLKIKHHLCNTHRAKDANIRQALIDKLGEPGTRKNPGPTHGIAKHAWSALAVAVTFAETNRVQQLQLVP